MVGLASEVRFQEETPTVRRIDTGAVLSLGVVGVTERGPLHEPILCNDFNEFKAKCGGYTANDLDLVAAVQGFFDNGGTLAWISRVVHHTTADDPTTKTSAIGTLTLQTASVGATAGVVTGSITGPWALVSGDTIVVSVDAGGNVTATFTATAGARESTATGPFALADLDTLTLTINGVALPTKTFSTTEFTSIAAATVTEVVASLNAFFAANGGVAVATATSGGTKVTITSTRKGTSSGVNVTGGTANAGGKLNFTTGNVAGTGNVANIAAVTAAEAVSIIGTAVGGTASVTNVASAVRITSATTGASSSVQVISTSTADDELGFDNAVHSGNAAGAQNTLRLDGKSDGAYANVLTVRVEAATSGDAAEFNLTVLSSGVVKERFVNLSMLDTAPRFVETIVNDSELGSQLIAAVDLDATIASPNDKPNAGTFGPLTGGSDGLASLADTDFIGGDSTAGATGFRVFDEVDIDVLIVPGRATSAVHNAMITYGEITRAGTVFSVLDPPANTTAQGMVTYVKQTASLYNLSEYAAIYWPRIKVVNPDRTLYGQDASIVVPPSGTVAGVYARVDASKIGGAFEHPAGTDSLYLPRNVVGLETNEVLKKAKRELVFPALINPISKEDGPHFIDGARCLRDNGNWPTIGQRRGVIFVEKKLIPGLAFMRHRNIKPQLFSAGQKTIELFLVTLAQNDAFASSDPKKAFFVDLGGGINNAATARARTVYARIGMATSEPAEFIVLLVTPDTRALDEELAALAA